MRTRQINVSIPKDSLELLDDFTDMCKELGLSRSEVLLELMTVWCADQPDYPRPNMTESMADELPEWLK